MPDGSHSGDLGTGGVLGGHELILLVADDQAPVHALLHSVVGPGSDLVSIHEGDVRVGSLMDLVGVILHVLNVTLHDHCHLLTGDGLGGRELAVASAIDNGLIRSPCHSAGIPGAGRHVGERCGSVVVQLNVLHPGDDGHEHGAGHGVQGGEGGVAGALEVVVFHNEINIGLVPGISFHVGELVSAGGEGGDGGGCQQGHSQDRAQHPLELFLHDIPPLIYLGGREAPDPQPSREAAEPCMNATFQFRLPPLSLVASAPGSCRTSRLPSEIAKGLSPLLP